MRIAHALEFALLQHTKQFHLQRRAHRANFVEKERSLVRLFEPALPIARRAGKCAAHVTEQFGLEQRFRDRAAVERDETVHPSRAVVVNRARDDFFA